ncbi:hypothetical protein [Maricaulis parjimensis]|uniref:hypothetical protein n=1 Tax=Maricaulis parjimensis TaxID=144023 RepID=UPI001939C4FB|nr:hypothetical protein [Maricaulis parjimensis]
MQAYYKFEPDHRLCVYRISGAITATGLLTLFRSARTDAGWRDNYRFLTILENASLAHMDTHAINELMSGMRTEDLAPRERQQAAIVSNDELSKGLLAFWVAASARQLGTQEKVFATESDARAWLAAEVEAIALPAADFND